MPLPMPEPSRPVATAPRRPLLRFDDAAKRWQSEDGYLVASASTPALDARLAELNRGQAGAVVFLPRFRQHWVTAAAWPDVVRLLDELGIVCMGPPRPPDGVPAPRQEPLRRLRA